MKRAATKKNGEPQPCNRPYRMWMGIRWSRYYYCRKPAGHKGYCGSQTIK